MRRKVKSSRSSLGSESRISVLVYEGSARSSTPALTLNESPGTTRPDVLPEDLIAVNPALDFSFDVTHVDASCLACLLEERDAYGLCLFVCFSLIA